MPVEMRLDRCQSDVDFPTWLEDVLPVQQVAEYVRDRLGQNEVNHILSLLLFRLDRTRSNGNQVTEGYAFVTLKHLVIDRHRSLQTKREEERILTESKTTPNVESSHWELASNEEIQTWAIEAINQLDPRSRIIGRLRHHRAHRFTYREIGDIIGFSESTVRIEYKRIRSMIRLYVKKKLDARQYGS